MWASRPQSRKSFFPFTCVLALCLALLLSFSPASADDSFQWLCASQDSFAPCEVPRNCGNDFQGAVTCVKDGAAQSDALCLSPKPEPTVETAGCSPKLIITPTYSSESKAFKLEVKPVDGDEIPSARNFVLRLTFSHPVFNLSSVTCPAGSTCEVDGDASLDMVVSLSSSEAILTIGDVEVIQWGQGVSYDVDASLSLPIDSILDSPAYCSIGNVGISSASFDLAAFYFASSSGSLNMFFSSATSFSQNQIDRIEILAPAQMQISSCTLSWRVLADSKQWLLAAQTVPAITPSQDTNSGIWRLDSVDAPVDANGLRIVCAAEVDMPDEPVASVFFGTTAGTAFAPDEPLEIFTKNPDYVAVAVSNAPTLSEIDTSALAELAGVDGDGVKVVPSEGGLNYLVFRFDGSSSALFSLFMSEHSFSSFVATAVSEGFVQLDSAVFSSASSGSFGQWLCADVNDSSKFGKCTARNECGSEPATPEQCVVEGSASVDFACAWADRDPITPDSTGCGAYMCKLKNGQFVDCANEYICEDGCLPEGTVPVGSPDPTANTNFQQFCVKDGKQVSSTDFCPEALVSYSPYGTECKPSSECIDVCFTESEGSMTRVNCSDGTHPKVCSTDCGVGIMTVVSACAPSSTAIGDVFKPLDDERCASTRSSDGGDSAEECTSTKGCFGNHFMCSTNLTATLVDQFKPCDASDTWGSCLLQCTHERLVKCITYVRLAGGYIMLDNVCGSQVKPKSSLGCNDGLCKPPEWVCHSRNKPLSEGKVCSGSDDTTGFGLCPRKGCNVVYLERTVACTRGGISVPEAHCSTIGEPPHPTKGCGEFSESSCRVSIDGVQCTEDENGNNVPSADGTCVPSSHFGKKLFRKGKCVDENGDPADGKCGGEKDLLQECNIGPCNDKPQWMCIGDDNVPKSCDELGAFPNCPTSGCGETKVTRRVACYQNKVGVPNDLCDSSTRPPTEHACRRVTNKCSVSFKNAECIYRDSDGSYVVDENLRKESCAEPNGRIFSKGECTDTEGKVLADDSWCDRSALYTRCTMPPCVGSDKWNFTWNALSGECIDFDSRCSTYYTNTVSCIASMTGQDSTFVSNELCLTAEGRPDDAVRCVETGVTCSPHSTCSRNSVPGNPDVYYGTCICSRGFTGADCGTAIIITNSAARFNGTNVVISWKLNVDDSHLSSLTGTATVGLSRRQGRVPHLFASADISKVTEVSVPAYDIYDSFDGIHEVKTWVIMRGLTHSADFTLPPLCTVEGLNCQNGGTCNTDSGTCSCKGDFTGRLCEISPCDALGCSEENGECVVSESGTASCKCNVNQDSGAALFADTRCMTPIGCENPGFCQNGGVIGGTFDNDTALCSGCSCPGHWEGERCNVCGLFDDCFYGAQDKSCSKCECAAGYDGEYCGCRFVTAKTLFAFPPNWYVPGSHEVNAWVASLQLSVQVSLGDPDLTASVVSHGWYQSRPDSKYTQVVMRLRAQCLEPANRVQPRGSATDNHADAVAKLHAAVERFKTAFATQAIATEYLAFFGIVKEAGIGLSDINCVGTHCPRNLGSGGDPPENSAPSSPSGSSASLSDGELVAVIVVSVVGGIVAITLIILAFRYGWLCFGSGSTPKMPSSSAGAETAGAEMAAA